jgi:carboxyl-terminal processing protease
VNDKSTEGLDSTKVADLLKGPKGTPVQIKVAREGYDKPVVFNIVRDEISRKSVPEAFLLKPNIGYIKHRAVQRDHRPRIRRRPEGSRRGHLKGLVLDLRGNPGGLLTEAVSVVDHLLPKAT